jgi:serine/threonine protein kinase
MSFNCFHPIWLDNFTLYLDSPTNNTLICKTFFQQVEMDGYELLEMLGRGAFGTAQLARRRSDGTRVVLKRVDLTEEDQVTAAASAKEVQALAKCRHPLVVRYLESFQYNGALIIAMEYVPGGTLRAFLRRQQQPLDETYVVTMQFYTYFKTKSRERERERVTFFGFKEIKLN